MTEAGDAHLAEIVLDPAVTWDTPALEQLVARLVGGTSHAGTQSPESTRWWAASAWRFVPQQTVDAFVAASADPGNAVPLTGFVRDATEAITRAVRRVDAARDPVRIVRRIDTELRRAYAQIATGVKVRLIRVLTKLLDAAVVAADAAAPRSVRAAVSAAVGAREPPSSATTPRKTQQQQPATVVPYTAPWARDALSDFIATVRATSVCAAAPPPPPLRAAATIAPAPVKRAGAAPTTVVLNPGPGESQAAVDGLVVPSLTSDDVSRAVMAQRAALRGAVAPSAPNAALQLVAIDAATDVYLRDSDSSAAEGGCPLRIPVRACYATRVNADAVKAVLANAPQEVRANVLHSATRHSCAPPGALAAFAGPPPHKDASASLALVATPPAPPPPPPGATAPGKRPSASPPPPSPSLPPTALDRFVRARKHA